MARKAATKHKTRLPVTQTALYVAGGGYPSLAVAVLLMAARDGDEDFLQSDFARSLCDGCSIAPQTWCEVMEAVGR